MSAHHHSGGGSPHWTRMELKTMDTKTIPSKSLSEALNDQLLETIDEELELEFDDQRVRAASPTSSRIWASER
jgi:hypothetical protein